MKGTDVTDIATLITRFGVTDRASLAVTHNGTGYFVVTPKAPYDGTASIEVQAAQMLEKLDARLTEIGSARDRILLTMIVLSDAANIEGFNTTWDAFFKGVTPPARGLVVADLAKPELKCELFVICAADPK